jgi:hypothetical protein
LKHAAEDFGIHQGQKRILVYEQTDCGVVNQNIAAAGVFDSATLYAPGFTRFMGQITTNTPIATTLSIRIVPRIAGALGGGGAFVAEEFPAAILVTALGVASYSFVWGSDVGLISGALVTGATFVFAPTFFVRVRNTGAQPANNTSLESVVCM